VPLARLIAQGRGPRDLAGLTMPSLILIDSQSVTKENVDQYIQFGWD
jgi:ribose transport system substrate-binding protein